MKKITFVLAFALVSSVGFAQSNLVTAKEMGDATAPTINYGYETSNLASCEFDIPSNNFENGYGPAGSPTTIWANDFLVSAGETMTVNQVSINVLTEPGLNIEEATIFFYEDSGNGPGALMHSQIDVEAISSDIIGSAFGFDVRRVVIDLDPMDFVGSASGETVYWMGAVVAYNGTSVYFEVTSILNTPNDTYVYDDADGYWTPSADAFDTPRDAAALVRTISGDCNVLGVNNNALSQVSVYPNPTTGILNLQTPSNVDVSSVALFDILGKKVNADYSNSTINMSALSQGIYLLKVETSAGTLTQKIVKQ